MPYPILSIAQMRSWEEATWASGISAPDVIARAGAKTAQFISSITPHGSKILFLAGRGHNGDDTRQAAAQIADRIVRCHTVTDPGVDKPKIEALLAGESDLVVDGLFGIGLNRPLDPAWIDLIETVNRSHKAVLAVDVPSGLNADSGDAMGAAIRAADTLTFGAPKSGLLSPSASMFTGRLHVAGDIGLIPCPFQGEREWILPEDFERWPPRRPEEGHKGLFGHLLIVAGSTGYHGAAVLAARAAQQGRPGLITLWTQQETYIPVASQLQAVMVHPWRQGMHPPDSVTAILAGPGLASPTLPPELKTQILDFWGNSSLPVVVDASALDWLPHGFTRSQALRVITPHPGEAARMLGVGASAVQRDRPNALKSLSKAFGSCHVVLKGRHTLTGACGGKLGVNSSGNPMLAQGGSGDVLAGFLGGLLAQPALSKNAEKTIRFAVWSHGAGADRLEEARRDWTLEDLASNLRAAHSSPGHQQAVSATPDKPS